jgi:hypothetical protein
MRAGKCKSSFNLPLHSIVLNATMVQLPYADRGRQFQRRARAFCCLKKFRKIFSQFLFPPKELVAGFNLDSLAHDVVPYSTLERD